MHGRDNVTTARLALDAAGRFLALDVSTLGNLGAYVSALGPGAHTNAPASAMGGLYAIPAIFMDVRGLFTNTVPIDAYRGAGKPEASYIIERLVDVAAHGARARPRGAAAAEPGHRLPAPGRAGRHASTPASSHANLDAVLAAAGPMAMGARRAAARARGRRLGPRHRLLPGDLPRPADGGRRGALPHATAWSSCWPARSTTGRAWTPASRSSPPAGSACRVDRFQLVPRRHGPVPPGAAATAAPVRW